MWYFTRQVSWRNIAGTPNNSDYILPLFTFIYNTIYMACLGGLGDWDTVHTDRDGLLEEPGSIPELAGRFHVQVPGAHALTLISWEGKEGSMVSVG